MKKLIFIFCLFLSIGLQAQTVSISCETCQWLKSSDCDVCSSIYKSKMFRGGLKIKKLGKTMYFEHPLSIELVNSKFKMTDANGQKFDFYLNETSFNSISALKSFIALCACSAPSDTSTIPQITDTDRRLTELAFVGDSLVATVRDINNNIVAKIVLDNAKGTTTPCRDSIWKVVDTIFHKNVFCNIQKVTMASSKTTEFHTLTSLSDTLTFTANAQANCPSLTIAKLDSCNVAYLYMFNCNTGAWEKFKTPNIYTAGKTLFVDEVTGTNNGKKGCPTCAFKEPYAAFRSTTEYVDGNTVKVEAGEYSLGFFGNGTSKEVQYSPYGLATNNYSTGIDTFRLHLEQGANIKFTQSRGIGTPHPAWVGWSNQPKFIGITGYGTFDAMNGTLFHHAVADGTFYMNIDKISTGYSVGEFMNKESVFNIGTINQTQGLTDYGGGLFFGPSLLSKTTRPKYSAKIKNWNVIDNRNAGFFTSIIDVQAARWSEISDGLQNANISVSIDNLDMKSYRNGLLNLYKYVADFDSNRIDISVNNIKYEGMNTETFTLGSVFQPDHLNAIFSQTAENFAEHINNTEVNIVLGNIQAKRFNITGQSFNIYDYIDCKIHIDAKNAILKEGVGLKFNGVAFDNTTIVIEGNWEIDYPAIYLIGCTFNNSKIIFKGNFKNTTANPLFYFNNCTFTNSKFIADGNFSTPDKILMVTGGSFDATSVIELQGTFKTTSTTLPAIDINNSRLFLKDCDIVTGGGFSIDSATPINVTVKPGCASNVTTSANVTQLGTGIYVDPNFNN